METMIDRLKNWLTTPGTTSPIILSFAAVREKESFLIRLKQQAVCQTEAAEPCGICSACQQAARGEHPDILVARPEKQTISVKKIHELLGMLRRITVRPQRLIIIEEAEKMSLPAVSALLKSLEEPAPMSRYLLVTQYPRRLPATIRSRCQFVRIPNVPEATATSTGTSPWEKSLLQRLANLRTESLTTETLYAIGAALEQRLREQGANPDLARAMQRLRDYYFITAQRGNERLAADVLFASLP